MTCNVGKPPLACMDSLGYTWKETLLRRTISHISSVTYNIQHQATILCPLVGNTPPDIKKSQDFANIRKLKLDSDEYMVSYVFTSPFTSSPTEEQLCHGLTSVSSIDRSLYGRYRARRPDLLHRIYSRLLV